MKKIILCLSIIFILFIGANYSISTIKADSGFDASFGGGSSSSSSHRSSNSSSSVEQNPTTFILGFGLYNIMMIMGFASLFSENFFATNVKQKIILITIIGYAICIVLYNCPIKDLNFKINLSLTAILAIMVELKQAKKSGKEFKILTKKLSDEEIKKIDFELDINKFNENVFQIYKDIQIAWMNFDLDSIRNLISDEIYNMYSMQLHPLKILGQQNIMDDIKYINSYISDISIENNIETIKSILKVSCYDYIINNKGKVIRGKKNCRNIYIYRITFEKELYNNNLKTCPNCGADININSSGICDSCNSTIINKENNWIMTKKEMLEQRKC